MSYEGRRESTTGGHVWRKPGSCSRWQKLRDRSCGELMLPYRRRPLVWYLYFVKIILWNSSFSSIYPKDPLIFRSFCRERGYFRICTLFELWRSRQPSINLYRENDGVDSTLWNDVNIHKLIIFSIPSPSFLSGKGQFHAQKHSSF